MSTYGTITLSERNGAPSWLIDAQPHVVTRLRRIFPRVYVGTDGLMLGDTPDVAADIEWVLHRWPMDMDNAAAGHLAAQADRYRESRQVIAKILEGYVPPDGWRDTAEPAREYQETAAALARETGRLLIADEVGLGKTLSALLLLRDPEALPAAVVTLTHLPRQWASEIRRFLPWLDPHVVSNGEVYDPLGDQRSMFGGRADVLILNYHKLDKWSGYLRGTVRTVIFDEAQELRRSASNKYQAAWSVKDPASLGSYLRDQGLMLRRTRVEVGRELPEVVRVPHAVDVDQATLDSMTSDAVSLAHAILDATGSNFDLMKASGELDWKLRHATGVAKAPYVAEFVKLLVEAGESVVLYGWHRSVYDIWNERLDDLHPAMFTGSESPARKAAEAERFMAGETEVLMMSLRAGAGLDGLQDRCRVCVFGELDWSPGVHTQAIGRVHRDGQTEPVVAYFLLADSGSDPVVAEVLNLKAQQADPIVDPYGDPVTTAPDVGDRVKRLAADFLSRRKGGTP